MKRIALSLLAAAGLAGVVAATAPAPRRTSEDAAAPPARSAREGRGATPYAEIENEAPPKLIVDEPLPDLLDKGVVWIQYRTENVHRSRLREGRLGRVPAGGPPARPRG